MFIVCGDFIETRTYNDYTDEWIHPIVIQQNKNPKYTRYNPYTNKNDKPVLPSNSFISCMIHNKQFLYTANFDGHVRKLDIETQYTWKFRGHTTTKDNCRIWCVKFLDENIIVSSGNDGIILGWDERMKQSVPCFKISNNGENRRIGNILVIDSTKFITSREPIDKYDKKTKVIPPKTFAEKIDDILNSNNNNNNNNNINDINDKNHQNNNQLICYDIRHCL
jgi:WD40 repeat protein